MLESVISRKFQSSSRIAAVTEVLRISEHDGDMSRAGEVRLLQHLLETSHDMFYRFVLIMFDNCVNVSF